MSGVLRGKNWPTEPPVHSPKWRARALAAEAELRDLRGELEAANAHARAAEAELFRVKNRGRKSTMSDAVLIDVARHFNRLLSGRKDGAKFRDTLLIPELKKGNRVKVDLSGCVGFPSSFAEEAFGGLVRALGESVIDKVEVVCDKFPKRSGVAKSMMNRARASSDGMEHGS